MKPYNGHRSWNVWNVALWISGDECLYRTALHCIETGKRRAKTKRGRLNAAVREFLACVNCGQTGKYNTTPDGAVYNPLSVKLALESLIE